MDWSDEDLLRAAKLDHKTSADILAQKHGIPKPLAHSLIGQESEWNQEAVSPKGAMGLTQLMPACVTLDCMALTANGWKRYDELSVGEQIFTYNITSSRIELQPLLELHFYENPGPLIRIFNQGFDFTVTQNHKWVIEVLPNNRRSINPQLVMKETTDLILPRRQNIVRGGEYVFCDTQVVDDDLVYLLGLVFADGSIGKKGNQIDIYQKDLVDLFRSAIEKSGVMAHESETEGKYRWCITGDSARLISTWLLHEGKKRLSTNLLTNITRKQADILWKSLLDTDASQKNNGFQSYCQSDLDRARDIQTLLFLIGKVSNLKLVRLAGTTRINGETYNTQNKYQGHVKSRNVTSASTTRTKYVLVPPEPVWCPSVENKTWVMWRDGYITITGNTAKDLGVNPKDPIDNLSGGFRYLKAQKDKFGGWHDALWAYNAGPERVKQGFMPDETKNYLSRIAEKVSKFVSPSEAQAAEIPGTSNSDLSDLQPIVPGNIDYSTRPIVKNADGTTSTVKSMSFGTDQGEVLVPTIADDGREMSPEEAFDQYRKTGKHLGIFKTPEEATRYAELHHAEMGPQDLSSMSDEELAKIAGVDLSSMSDEDLFKAAGIVPERNKHDGMYHWSSSDPKTGEMLKSEDHPTAWMEHFMRKFGYDPEDKGITKDVGEKMLAEAGATQSAQQPPQQKYPIREVSQDEDRWFKKNPKVGGMADFNSGTIVLNPYSTLSEPEKQAVAKNEFARLTMRQNNMVPNFELTDKQKEAFKKYGGGDELAQKETIVGRIISGDPSALDVTQEQKEFASKVSSAMSGLGQPAQRSTQQQSIGGLNAGQDGPTQDLSGMSDEELAKIAGVDLSSMSDEDLFKAAGIEARDAMKDDRSWGQRIAGAASPYVRPVLETSGMVAGGIAGSAVAPVAGTMAGAGLGYGMGAQAADLLEEYAGTKPTESLPGRFISAGKQVLTGAALEGGGQVVGPAISAWKGGMSTPAVTGQLSGQAAKVAGREALSRETGVKFTPAQTTQKKSVGLLESQLEKNMGSTNIVQKARQEQAKQVQDYAIKVQEEFFGGTVDPLAAGRSAQKTSWNRYRAFNKKASILYDRVPVPPETKIDTKNLADAAAQHMDELGKLESPTIKRILRITGKAENASIEVSPILDAQGNRIIQKSVEPAYTWSELRADKSSLGKMIEKTSDFNNKRILRSLSNAIGDDIAAFSAKVEDPAVKETLEIANKFYREGDKALPGIRVWKDSQIRQMMNSTSPEDVAAKFFKAKPNVSDITRLRQVAGPRSFQKIKQAWFEGMISQGEQQSINHARFSTAYDKYKMTDNLDVMLTKAEREGLDNLYEVSKTITTAEKMSGNPSGTGQTTINELHKWVRHPVWMTVTQLSSKKIADLYFNNEAFRSSLIRGMKTPDMTVARKMAGIMTRVAGTTLDDEEREE